MKLPKNQMISPKYFRFPRWKIRNFLGRKPESYRWLVLVRLVSLVALRTFHPLMQFLKNDVFDDFIGCLIV